VATVLVAVDDVSGVATPASRHTLRVSCKVETPSFQWVVTSAAIFGSKSSESMDVKSPPKRPMEVAKKMHASRASRSDAESSMRFNEEESMVKKEWTRLVTHMDKSEADEEAPFLPGEARKIALN
jgi:hypothetical protein